MKERPETGSKGTKPAGGPKAAALDAEQVAGWLVAHPDFLPDFLMERPELLAACDLPESGGGVVDFRGALIARQRDQVAALENQLDTVIETARANQEAQGRLFAALLRLIDCSSAEALARALTQDLPAMLDVDSIVLAAEPGPGDMVLSGARIVPEGSVEARVGTRPLLLAPDSAADPLIFGEAATGIRSHALARLDLGSGLPLALVALGSRDPLAFHPTMATDQLRFFIKVVERLIAGAQKDGAG
jgi:uncharacterized protein YigA (DUF484 family)